MHDGKKNKRKHDGQIRNLCTYIIQGILTRLMYRKSNIVRTKIL